MSLARCAKRRVLSVSAMLRLDELTLAIMNVLELPPRESCLQHVASAGHDASWQQGCKKAADGLWEAASQIKGLPKHEGWSSPAGSCGSRLPAALPVSSNRLHSPRTGRHAKTVPAGGR